MIKKSLIFLGILVLLCSLVLAQENKLGIDIAEGFSPGEPVTFKINIFDSNNNVIPGEINVRIEDAEKTNLIEKTVQSGELVSVNLENARAGYWSISASYNEAAIKEFFSIEASEKIEFSIEGDILTVKNIGNSRYTKNIDIIIGDSLGTKKVDLDAGEQMSFRLIAPDGTYLVKITDGETTYSKASVSLTGNVIGILDKNVAESKGSVTGGLRPESESIGEETFKDSVRNKSFVYVFILVVVGAAILLAIERRYRKKI